jgi:hypothetical protein
MIISASGRTDIPAYYGEWFFNRVKDGTVCVRNPYYPEQVQGYQLDASVVDSVVFCTKNPRPMLARLREIVHLRPFFFVTITPYGRDIEPNVPDRHEVAVSVVELARMLGSSSVCWRYDPILLNGEYSADRHIEVFSELCALLESSVLSCVVSFLQSYAQTPRNFPGAAEPTPQERRDLLETMVPLAAAHGIEIRTCADYAGTRIDGLGESGCVTRSLLRQYTGIEAPPLPGGPKREGCRCDLPTRDIGVYNTCPHGCKYCYANHDMKQVMANYRKHDPASPLLIGALSDSDRIAWAKQESFGRNQLSLDLF